MHLTAERRLLARLFVCPQGMADVVDPNFSIYTQALPFAVRRALSPETEKGEQTLRSALLTDTGEFRFNRLMQLLARTPIDQSRRSRHFLLPLGCLSLHTYAVLARPGACSSLPPFPHRLRHVRSRSKCRPLRRIQRTGTQ